ncbi:hypothetical protein SO802_007222 [Lithocarpus litseifolius]|uniref:Uncharacterized protein n=1 Tax=Lithocarpus litseifolius TaxID=425828 RepID=A0AAW2DRJ9_9ROSI
MAAELRRWVEDCVDKLCDIIFGKFLLGNMCRHVPHDPVWDVITHTPNARFEKAFRKRQGGRHATNLWKKGCPDYDKLKQLFVHSIAIGKFQIFSNKPALNSNVERALEEEVADDGVPTHLDDDCYTSNLESIPQTVEETEAANQTQRARKHLMQDVSAKGKKVSKKDSVNDTTVALREYTTMTREMFSSKQGKTSGTSEQFAQSVVGGDPCSLGKAIEVFNQYENRGNKAYVKIFKALQQKEKRVMFMGMPEHWRQT